MRLVRVAAAAVGVAVLAGCSTGATANETLPSTSATAAETTESLPPLGPADLLMPDAARQMTAAGAEAFLRYYMDVYNAAQGSMDSTYMDRFSEGCSLCDDIMNNLRKDATAGYSYSGGQVTVLSLSAGTIGQSSVEIAFTMNQAPLTVRADDGTAIGDLSAPAASLNCGAILNWSDSETSWVLAQWDVN
jgi:hypothetical protein